MPPPKGTRVIPFIISDRDAVLVYSVTGRVWLQLRHTVPTDQDIAAPSFKVAVTLTPEQAIALAGELLTAATHHGPLPRSPLAERPGPPPAVLPTGQANRGRPWTETEEKKLLEAFDASTPIPQIAKAHGRGTGGIQSRLVKLGRLTREQYRSYPPDNADASSDEEAAKTED